MCEITQCAQNYTKSIGNKSSQLKNFTLTPWAAWATNISCGSHLLCNVVGMAADGEEPQYWEALIIFVLNLVSQILMMDLVWRIEIMGKIMMIAKMGMAVTILTDVVVIG